MLTHLLAGSSAMAEPREPSEVPEEQQNVDAELEELLEVRSACSQLAASSLLASRPLLLYALH